MNTMQFSFRIDNMELRSCGKNLLQNQEHNTAEIIYWEKDKEEKDYCYVIAYYEISKDNNVDLQFVGDRPFSEKIDWNQFYKIAKQGQEVLNNWYSYFV